MRLRKSPDSSLLNSDQPPLGSTSTPNPDTVSDDPPPAYGAPASRQFPSSQPSDAPTIDPQDAHGGQETPQTQAATTQGYAANPPMSSTTPALKPWEFPPEHQAALEKAPGCFCSTRGGCFCSDMGGFCFSSNGGCFFSDNKGCFCSDHAGFCFGDYGGCFCSGRDES